MNINKYHWEGKHIRWGLTLVNWTWCGGSSHQTEVSWRMDDRQTDNVNEYRQIFLEVWLKKGEKGMC